MNDVSRERRVGHFASHLEEGFSECHGCGGVMPGHLSIWADNLCQHFVNLCSRCLLDFRALIESSGQPTPPAPISKEAQSLMDTTAGGRATADLVSCQPTPSPAPSMSIDEALRQMENAIEDAIDHKFYSHGEPERYRAALAVLREATKPPAPSDEERRQMVDVLDDWKRTLQEPETEAIAGKWVAGEERVFQKIRALVSAPPPPVKVSREWVEEMAGTLNVVKWNSRERRNEWLINRLREKGIIVTDESEKKGAGE